MQVRSTLSAIALASLLLGGCSTAPAHSSAATTPITMTQSSPAAATAAPPDTGSTAASSGTSVAIYSPFDGSGPAANLTVTFSTTGTCQASGVDMRPDAYRCFTDTNDPRGGNLEDPCFAAPDQAAPYLLCAASPLITDVFKVTPDSPVASNNGSPVDPATATPWWLVLSNGDTCGLIAGATDTLAGMRLNYGCSSGGNIYGDPDRSGPTWRVYFATPGSTALQQADVATAYF